MIAIIDYGMGNLRSVEKAFQFLGFAAHIVQDVAAAATATHLVLPGDAAFGDAMRHLREAGWEDAIHRSVEAGKPFLGICAGLQLMFAGSDEMGEHTGLNLLPGRCTRFPDTERVPQIGWNQISIQRQVPLMEDVVDGSFYYFVHSYYVQVSDMQHCIATTEYGIEYTSIAGREHIYGVQFHPEKSQDHGLRLLANFARLN